jgi:hypothetical protein
LILAPRGVRLGYGNFIFLVAAILPVWIVGARNRSTGQARAAKNGTDSGNGGGGDG